MSRIVLVYALFSSADEAKSVARAVVGERLAACANVLSPCTSIYEWQGVMEESAEVPVLFKTSSAKRDALMARISALHSYEVPAILAWDSGAVHALYAEWLSAQVS